MIQPFYSQQDKETNRFLLDADVTTQISRFLAEALQEEGAEVSLILPPPSQCSYPDWTREFNLFSLFTPTSNRDQRLSFDPVTMAAVLDGCDLFVTHNELVAFKARQIATARLKIVHFNHLLPLGGWAWMEPLQSASWAAADLVVFMAPNLKHFATSRISPRYGREEKMVVWPMVYDERFIRHRGLNQEGRVDILFVQRCSSTNYTHHREFLQAVSILRDQYGWGGRVVFTDPTRYLELRGPHESCGSLLRELDIEFARCDTRESYYELLSETKIAVALMTQDLHGGVAIREAIATGCIPVLLAESCYQTMLGDYACRWPYFVPQSLEPSQTARILVQAIRAQQHSGESGGDLDIVLSKIRKKIREESYQQAWRHRVRRDLTNLLGR